MERNSGSTTRWDYFDFELEIREGGPREYPVFVRSPAGEAQAQMRFPFDQWELKDRLQALEIALLRSGGTRRRIPSPEEKTVQDFGRGLFEALLVGEVRTRYEVSLSEARRRNKGLRLKLRISSPELAVLPWEFLYDAQRDLYVCLSSTTPLVRHLDLPQPVEPLSVSPPLKVLGMVTSPLGLDPLDVGHEKRLVEEAIKDLRSDGMFDLTWLEGQTWRHLQRTMRRGHWHIFHFVGHGGFDPVTEEGAIALSDEAGRKRLLRATSLAGLLDDHYPLRLVFLNSCEGARGSDSDAFSSTAATLVRRGVPAVVAMQYEITDTAAIEFSRAFYEAVADGLPVDAAVTQSRVAVSMDSMLEWGTPVLYMRSPDGRIFDIAAATLPREFPPETRDLTEHERPVPRPGEESAVAQRRQQSPVRSIISASNTNRVRLLRTLGGHMDLVWSVAFSPDGTLLASGQSLGSMRLWRVEDGESLYKFKGHAAGVTGHAAGVNSVAFSPDGTLLASGSWDYTARLWQVEDRIMVGEFKLNKKGGWRSWLGFPDHRCGSVAFSPDGTLLASGSYQTLQLWRVEGGEPLRTLEGHAHWVNNVAFSPDGTLLASAGSTDNTVRLWGIA